MEKGKNIRRGLLTILGVGAGVLALSSCTNYSGEGNEFEVEGQVVDAGDQSLKVIITDVNYANGDAEDWFEIGSDHRLHDNCDCHGMWHGRKKYGVVYDYSGMVIEPNDVPEGACVLFEGKVRDDKTGKRHELRPVFEVAQLILCE